MKDMYCGGCYSVYTSVKFVISLDVSINNHFEAHIEKYFVEFFM